MSSEFYALVDVELAAMELRAKREENQNKKILFFFKNRNWGRSPPPCSSSLLRRFYKDLKMENPQNPNPPSSSLTENKGRKRRAVPQGERKGRVKKAKVQTSPKTVERETPSWLVQMVKHLNGENLSFIFEKELTTTDVNPSQSRLLMPLNGLVRNDFLTPEELSIIHEDENKKKKIGVGAIVVNSRARISNVSLKIWNMTKPNYSLASGWNKVVKDNDLEEGDNIGLWSFRTNIGILCLALVRLS